MRNFSEWVEKRKIDESFTSLSQSPGDMVYFGAHDILSMPDDSPIDRTAVGQKLSVIKTVGPKGIVVDAPERHNFRANSVKKFMSKDGGFTIPPDHLQEISPNMVAGGLGNNSTTGQPQKLFIFAPNPYTKKMLEKKNARMSQEPPMPQARPQVNSLISTSTMAHGDVPGAIPQAPLPQQPQLPSRPFGRQSFPERLEYNKERSYRYY